MKGRRVIEKTLRLLISRHHGTTRYELAPWYELEEELPNGTGTIEVEVTITIKA